MKSSRNTLDESLQIATPAWPLQNTVAVNPFWYLRHKTFHFALEDLSQAVHAPLFMPLHYYIERLRNGEITDSSLKESLEINRQFYPELPNTVEDFIRASQIDEPVTEVWKTFSEQYEIKKNWHSKVTNDVGKYCAAYLDDQQAIARFPWKQLNFWQGWHEAQKLDRSMERWGADGFRAIIDELKGLDSENGIRLMLDRMGFRSNPAENNYMQRLIASCLGWASQFKYAEWQRQLGYSVETKAEVRDLLAVRMAYDFGLFCISDRDSSGQGSSETKSWQASFNSLSERTGIPSFWRHHVFQLAFELSYQKQIISKIRFPTQSAQGSTETSPTAQIAFCIDVRSELLRRHIELSDKKLVTIGFAGFFGVPFDYKPAGETKASHRLPVLLTPAFEIKESYSAENQEKVDKRVIFGQVSSFFRSLRKNPLSSFVYVELFGALYIEKMIRRTFLFLIENIRGRRIPHRFDHLGKGTSQSGWVDFEGLPFGRIQKIERAETVLRHMGLTGPFAPLVLILGHGSVTANNAFGSSLDCGACGGNAGDVNARFLVDLLNDISVREGLLIKGIQIPPTTWFIAGVHETVTDDVHILETEKVPVAFQGLLSEVTRKLTRASEGARKERPLLRSNVLDLRAHRRSQNWSEVRPEWGLAGNACFIVAPRRRTREVNLGSRSFLHDYDWQKDAGQNYKTLELIMTAPMIVTNWINLQYYASTVAPAVYGSGNKVLHNITNESGVVEGNGGDLRIGLPFQSIHDGNRFVHDPLRLSVFIEAPREEIEKIIENHEVVRQLVDQNWLHLLHIESSDLKVSRRSKGGNYKEVFQISTEL